MSYILGLIVFGGMLALLVIGMRTVNDQIDSSSRRSSTQRDTADKSNDGSST